MKPKLLGLLIAFLLPVLAFSQSFNVNAALKTSEDELFMKNLYKNSVLLQTMQAALSSKADISDNEARILVEEKLKALKNPELDRLYAAVSPDNIAKIGVILYLIMGGLNHLPAGSDLESQLKDLQKDYDYNLREYPIEVILKKFITDETNVNVDVPNADSRFCSYIWNTLGITNASALPTAKRKKGKTRSVGVQPCQGACSSGV